jgi:dihydroneopterin aldolase
MDRVKLIGVQIYGHHGVTPSEREIGQRFKIDVEMGLDLRTAGRSDRVHDTVDYQAVYGIVETVTRERRYHLIEAMAEDIASSLLEKFPRLKEVRVCVKKPGAAIGAILDHAEVEILRTAPEP